MYDGRILSLPMRYILLFVIGFSIGEIIKKTFLTKEKVVEGE